MLKDVTFGRYYQLNSPVHSLDPRTKLLWLVLYVASVIITDSIALTSVLFLFLICAIILSRVPLKYLLRGLRTVFAVVLITDILNVILTENGFEKSLVVSIKTIQVILASNLVSVTTKPKDIADGIEKAFGRINVHDFATMVMIALRFIPILTSEAENIMNAQKARGADFENGSIIKRAKALSAIIIPVFVCAVRKSDALAVAMDSRLYGFGKPSRLHSLNYSKNDYIAMLITIAVFGTVLVGRFLC